MRSTAGAVISIVPETGSTRPRATACQRISLGTVSCANARCAANSWIASASGANTLARITILAHLVIIEAGPFIEGGARRSEVDTGTQRNALPYSPNVGLPSNALGRLQ